MTRPDDRLSASKDLRYVKWEAGLKLMTLAAFIPLASLVAAHAQTVPAVLAPGRGGDRTPPAKSFVLSKTDIAAALAAKQDYNGDSSGQHILPKAGTVGTLADLLSGGIPLPGVRINPHPTTEAPIYTSGNTADLLLGNSQHASLPEMWSILDGGSQHDGVSAITRSLPGSIVTQFNALAGYCDNANPNNMTVKVGVCVGVNAAAINRVDGTQSWLFAGIASDAGGGGPLGRLLQSEWDYKPRYPNTAVNGLILAMDGSDGAVRDAFIAGATPGHFWRNGFRTYPGQDRVAFLADLADVVGVPNGASQPIVFELNDAKGDVHGIRLHGMASNYLYLDRDDGGVADLNLGNGSLFMRKGRGLFVAGVQVLAERQAGWSDPAQSNTPPLYGPISYDSADFVLIKRRMLAIELALRHHGLIGN